VELTSGPMSFSAPLPSNDGKTISAVGTLDQGQLMRYDGKLISLGVNYIPMLIYAIAITRAKSARSELGSELDNKRLAMKKYRRNVTQ